MGRIDIDRRALFNPRVWTTAITGAVSNVEQTALLKEEHFLALTIEKHLGLNGNQIRLKMIFPHHDLTPEAMKIINKDNIDILLGEVEARSLVDSLTTPIEKIKGTDVATRATSPGIGSTTESRQFDAEQKRKLINDGYTIVTTDGNKNILHFDGSKSDSALLGIVGGLVLVGGVIGSVFDRYTHDGKFSRRGFILGAAVTTASSVIIYQAYNFLSKPGTDRNSLDEAGLKLLKEVENVINDPVFIGFYEGVGTLRSKVMAQNTWQTIARSANKSEGTPTKILFNAGSGHGEAMDEFLKGPEALTIEISVYADRLVDETLNRLLDNDQNEEAVLRQMALYSRLFSEPHQVGPYNTLTNGVDEGKIPNSARTILINRIFKKLKAHEAKEEQKKHNRRFIILDRLLTELLKDELEVDTMLVEVEKSVSGRDVPQKIAYISLPNSQIPTITSQKEITWISNGRMISGPAIFRGLSHPATRMFTYDPVIQRIRTADSIYLYRNTWSQPKIEEFILLKNTDGAAITPCKSIVFQGYGVEQTLSGGNIVTHTTQPDMSDQDVYAPLNLNRSQDPNEINLIQVLKS